MEEMSYEWLIDYQKRTNEFWISDIGCGMQRYRSSRWGNKGLILVNSVTKEVFPLVWPDGEITLFTKDDIDWDSVGKLEHNYDAQRMHVDYRFDIGKFEDGVARLDWMLYPDGQYFADEDGFGMEDNDEVNVSAYIDTRCRVLVKFQDMEKPERAKALFQEACRISKGIL